MSNVQPINAFNVTQPHAKVSDRYKFVSTKEALDALTKQGFETVRATSRSLYGLHTATLEHPDLSPVNIGGSIVRPQVILKNSHDTSAAFGLYAGAFRLACLNGLVLGRGFAVRLIHTGNIQQDIKESLPKIFEVVQRGVKQIEAWSQFELTEYQIRAYAATQLDLRFSDEQLLQLDVGQATEALITPIRPQDMSNDLFTVYNRVQERLINGKFKVALGNEIRTVRKLSGIRSTLALNQALSQRTENLYKHLTEVN